MRHYQSFNSQRVMRLYCQVVNQFPEHICYQTTLRDIFQPKQYHLICLKRLVKSQPNFPGEGIVFFSLPFFSFASLHSSLLFSQKQFSNLRDSLFPFFRIFTTSLLPLLISCQNKEELMMTQLKAKVSESKIPHHSDFWASGSLDRQ